MEAAAVRGPGAPYWIREDCLTPATVPKADLMMKWVARQAERCTPPPIARSPP